MFYTHRQGLIRDCALMLAGRRPYSTESNYRQNVWTVIDENLVNKGRRVYWQHTSLLAKTRLYNAIAREAVIQDRRINFSPINR